MAIRPMVTLARSCYDLVLARERGVRQPVWTRDRVEARLVAAFVAMPSCPVYSRDGRLRTAAADASGDLAAVLAWPGLLGADPTARTILLSWARCRASRASFAELCRDMGWNRATAEVARRRGADAIAKALNDVL